jgi:prepilin-type N-terminal cleavage/methylation domain-containing protein
MDPKRFSHSQAGFTLIEVLVAALIVGLVAAGAASAFVSSLNSSGSLRLQAQAQTLAEQSQNRLRSMNIDELSNLDDTRTVNVSTPAGLSAPFTVHETASYVSDADGEPSCSNPSADYLKTSSTVTWPNMAGRAPVTLSSVLTPSIGEIASDRGTLAVSVIDDQTAGIANATVAVTEQSGSGSASGMTSSQGCVLFGDLPVGTYTVTVTPPAGTWVDAKTGKTVTAAAPDTTTATVNAGSKASAPAQVQIGLAGSAQFAFQTVYPLGVSGSATGAAPAVVLANPNFNSPSYRLCTPADATSGCPAIGSQETAFPTEATSIGAAPLFPTIYTVYPGVCSSDEPSTPAFGDTDGSVTVVAGQSSAPVTLTVPAMVVQLYSGSTANPGVIEALPNGANIVITDTGCGVRYIGYTGTPPPITSKQAALPLVTGVASTGLLASPGMPDGTYTVCYQAGSKKYVAPAVTNHGRGEVINLYAGSTRTGTC